MLTRDRHISPQQDIPKDVLTGWDGRLEIQGKLASNVWTVNLQKQCLVLKRRDVPFDSEREHLLLRRLHEQNIPVAISIPTAQGKTSLLSDGGSWTLYPKLRGSSRSLSTMTASDANAIGAVLGRLHVAFDNIRGHEDAKRLVLPGEFADCRHGLIHRDFHASNVLFENGSSSGIVDFDLLCEGPRVFDLAYLGASLLADAWQDPPTRERFLPVLTDIVRGYRGTYGLTAAEGRAIPNCLEAVESLFVAFGRSKGCTQMEMAATEVLNWLVDQRSAIIEALRKVL